MNNTSIFDVLVVYTDNVATSASSKIKNNNNPFALATGREHYEKAYSYFLTKCANSKLKIAFTTSGDITGSGTCNSYWIYKNRKWIKKMEFGFAPLIFDKFSPILNKLKDKSNLLFLDGTAKPFNDPDLLLLFNDKLATYNRLEEFSIPTVMITEKSVENSIKKLEKIINQHGNQNDFTDKFVLKDRFGAGGLFIFMIGSSPVDEIKKIIRSTPGISFVLQPFANFENGYHINKTNGYADIRMIYSQGKVIQRYVRTPGKNDFRCNEHQGGKVIYIGAKEIPKCVKLASNKISDILKKENAFFALDFLVSNNGNAYLLEGNIKPGIYWGLTSREDKINTKKLIRKIISEIGIRVKTVSLTN